MSTHTRTKAHRKAPRVSNRIDPAIPNRAQQDEVDGDEESTGTGINALQTVAKIAVKTLQGFAHAKKAAGKWRHYATIKRKFASDGTKSSARNGQGLDDINEEITGHQRRSISASSRALIQYFAKLGQSSRADEALDLDFVESLLKGSADVNCTDIYGQTIFHEVARTWHVDVGKFLIEHGGDLNKADKYGRTPLHVAAAVDYADMCEFLINNGANKEAVTKGEKQTPLFYAARNDATKALTVLIKCECEYKEVRDYRGRTPLYVAAELDRSETARFLLENNAPVGIVDNSGQPALTWMINKMAPVAKEALDQLHTCDRANRKQYFYLNHLEPIKPVKGEDDSVGQVRDGHAQMPLQVAARVRQFDLLLHPVLFQLVKIKWNMFGWWGALRQLALQVLFISLWSIIALHSPWFSKCHYELPTDIWKIAIYVLAVGITVYQIIDELMEFVSSQRKHQHWKEWRIKQIDEDIAHCHPRWPEEKQFLENEKNDLDKFKSNYFQDFWNIFDWVCYTFLLASTTTHLVDVTFPGIVIAQVHNRIMSINIIMVWLRTMKYVRCYSTLGPFIVMLGEMVGDMAKFIFLYLIFLIPFFFAFWMVFGGDYENMPVTNTTASCVKINLEATAYQRVNVNWMTAPEEMLFSVFRLTLVDEYDLDGMLAKDKEMTYVLLFLWFGISAILCLNLFIALLSDTFQRVYDNARANAVMQKAVTVLMIEDKLWKTPLHKYRTHIQDCCAPEIVYYDDDTGEGGDELKKVTIQTKEQVQELMELWTIKYGEPSTDEHGLKYYGGEEGGDEGGGDGGDEGHDGGTGGGGNVGSNAGSGGKDVPAVKTKESVTNAKLENEIDILRAELTQVEKKRREFEKKCLHELSTLKTLLVNGAGAGTPAPQVSARLPPLLPDYGHIQGVHFNQYDITSPPTYPAAIAERMTPRDDQLRSDASTSHVDIATLPHTGTVSAPSGYTPAVRVNSAPMPREAFGPNEASEA